MRSRWALFAVLIVPVMAASSSAGDDVSLAIGYIRTVDGAAVIRSNRGQRTAEVFSPLWAGDVIAVTGGSVTVCDMRTGQSFDVKAGAELELPSQIAHENVGLYESLRAALTALVEAPEQDGHAVVRGGARAKWPDQVRLAPAAAILFRWPAGTHAASFDLERREPTAEIVYHRDQPSSPVPWPGQVARTPGRYRWYVRDARGRTTASGQFTLISAEEAAAQRARFAAKTGPELAEPQRDLVVELLAAKDDYVLR